MVITYIHSSYKLFELDASLWYSLNRFQSTDHYSQYFMSADILRRKLGSRQVIQNSALENAIAETRSLFEGQDKVYLGVKSYPAGKDSAIILTFAQKDWRPATRFEIARTLLLYKLSKILNKIANLFVK